MQRRQRRDGFTVIELLFVIGIIAVLLAAALPAVQKARETARQTTCQEHLRTIALALHNYHDTHKVLPPGQINRTFASDSVGRYANPSEARVLHPPGQNADQLQGTSWIVQILPMLGQSGLFDAWNFDWNVRTNGEAGNSTGKGGPPRTELAVLYCPSRRSGMMATGRYAACDRVHSSWTTGGNDYAGCAGSGVVFSNAPDSDQPTGHARQAYALTPTQLQATMVNGYSPFTQAERHAGLFGVNSSTTFSEVQNGTANVIMVSERQLFTTSSPNERVSSDGWAWGGPATLFSTRLAPHSLESYDEADSAHVGLVQVAMADGSVRQISFNIDLKTWQNLGNMTQYAAIAPSGSP